MQLVYHPITRRQLDSITKGSASYMFVGQPGSGRSLAIAYTLKRLNCLGGGDDACAICRNIEAGSFPDYIEASSADKKIGIDQIQSLGASLANRPLAESSQRLVYIDADMGMTAEAQNRLLKTFEEPPPQTIIIIATTSTDQILPTIQSRSQIVNFLPLSRQELHKALVSKLGHAKADEIMALRPVTIGQALSLATDSVQYNQRSLFGDLAKQYVEAPLFKRLTMSAKKEVIDQPTKLLDAMASLTIGEPNNFDQLSLIEKAKRRLQANVGARSVLEALAVEL